MKKYLNLKPTMTASEARTQLFSFAQKCSADELEKANQEYDEMIDVILRNESAQEGALFI